MLHLLEGLPHQRRAAFEARNGSPPHCARRFGQQFCSLYCQATQNGLRTCTDKLRERYEAVEK